jgi:Ca2+-binding RTX toxin-like protein
LYGEVGNDLLFGGKGNDLIFGGSDNDTLDGGTGSDDFVFLTSIGPNNDVINNFEVSVDQIKFKGSEVNNIFDVLAIMSQDGADVVITVAAGNTITLTDIDLNDLTAGNFLFG